MFMGLLMVMMAYTFQRHRYPSMANRVYFKSKKIYLTSFLRYLFSFFLNCMNVEFPLFAMLLLVVSLLVCACRNCFFPNQADQSAG